MFSRFSVFIFHFFISLKRLRFIGLIRRYVPKLMVLMILFCNFIFLNRNSFTIERESIEFDSKISLQPLTSIGDFEPLFTTNLQYVSYLSGLNSNQTNIMLELHVVYYSDFQCDGWCASFSIFAFETIRVANTLKQNTEDFI